MTDSIRKRDLDLRTASDVELATNLRSAANDLTGLGRTGLEYCNPWFELINTTIAMVLEAHDRLNATSERLAQLERLTLTDELTGLLNRRGIEEQLHQELAAAQRHREGGVLIFMDLDEFKPVNDTLGHDAGDEVLRQVGTLLRGNVRESDSVGRIGGDEFVVLMPRSPQHTGLTRAGDLEHLINHAYANWNGMMIPLRASCGTHVYQCDDDWRTVLRNADADMYRKKNESRRGRAANDGGIGTFAPSGLSEGACA